MKLYKLTSDQIFLAAMESASQNVGDHIFDTNDWQFATPSFRGRMSHLRLSDGLVVKITNFVTNKPVVFTSETAMPHLIDLGFVTSGVVEMNVRGSRRDCDAIAGQNYLRAMEGDLRVKTSLPAGQHVQSIDVRFTPEALDQCCHQIGSTLPAHLKQYCSVANKAPYKRASVLTPEMRILANEIIAHSSKETFCSLFLESKCFDLVAHYLTVVNERSAITTATLSPRDIERICEARHILTERMANPPSLMELARLVNLNDFKLKQGFRQAFGTTAYSYLKELRLQRAQTLLRDQNKSVTETAFTVGYGNIGDFGIAFKRRFGVSPKYFLQGEKSVIR